MMAGGIRLRGYPIAPGSDVNTRVPALSRCFLACHVPAETAQAKQAAQPISGQWVNHRTQGQYASDLAGAVEQGYRAIHGSIAASTYGACQAMDDAHIWYFPETPELHMAAVSGNLTLVQELLTQGADVDCPDQYGMTALRCAVERGHVVVVEHLLDAGASPNDGEPLRQAVLDGQEDIARLLLAHGADPDPALVTAAAIGNDSLVQLLLEQGANPTGLAVTAAASRGHEEAADLLGRARFHPPDLAARDLDGRTPLHLAVRDRLPSLAASLIAQGADVNARDTQGVTPLHLAVEADLPELVTGLVGAGADPRSADNHQRTPLHWAAAIDSPAAIAALAGSKSSVSLADNKGMTPLHLAVEADACAAVSALLSIGADTGRKNERGYAPIHVGAREGVLGATRLLLSNGVGVNTRDGHGATPLHHAAECGRYEVVELLLGCGADLGAEDTFGRTPLAEAVWGGHSAVVHVLVVRGAPVGNVAARYGDYKMDLLLREAVNARRRKSGTVVPPRHTTYVEPDPAWRCRGCGHSMRRSQWKEREARIVNSLLWQRVWYKCPACGGTVELWVS